MMEVYYQNGEPTSSNLDLLRQKYKTILKVTEAEDLHIVKAIGSLSL